MADPSWADTGGATPVRVEAEVVRNGQEGETSWRLVLRVPGWPGFRPGQFAMLSAGPRMAVARTDPLLPRPMAIYRAQPENGGAEVEILYKVVGRGTGLLADALPGHRVGFVGPLGRPFPPPRAGERVIVVAGGTGIASVYDLAAQLAEAHPVEILFGARTAADLMAIADFEALGVSLRTATEDGSVGTRGLVTELLESTFDELQRGGTQGAGESAAPACRVYTCGPTAMMKRCAEIASQRGLRCIAALENAMACGFGVCLGCAAPLKRGGFALVCRDGPAFDADAIDWERLP